MGRSQHRGGSSMKHTQLKRRCSMEGCKKRAMDIINGEYLCRVHSPCRHGYGTIKKEEI